MNVLMINTFDRGGAANACIRLHRSFLNNELVNSKLLLKHQTKEVPSSVQFEVPPPPYKINKRIHNIVDRFVGKKTELRRVHKKAFIKNLPSSIEYFSFPDSGVDLTKSKCYQEADIIHLHWVSDFIDYETFFKKNKKPIIWTLHDMEPFSGGYHYENIFYGLDEFGWPIESPYSESFKEEVKTNLNTKLRSLVNVNNVTIVAPSKWLTDLSSASILFNRFPHYTIPNGFNTELFCPRDRNFAKGLFGIPIDKICLLFVSDDLHAFRKGFAFLKMAFKKLNSLDLFLCAVGSNNGDQDTEGINYLGRIEDERLMSLVYSSADCFIIPSIEDNLPNTMIEALLCGTPVIGFPVGGINDVVKETLNGFMCKDLSVDSLVHCINRFIEFHFNVDRQLIAHTSKKSYDLMVQSNAYSELYKKITTTL